MTNKNKYIRRSKISEAKFRELVRYFALDLDASQIAMLSGLNRNTVNRYLNGIRLRIAQTCEQESPLSGEVEVDESFFGARRVRGKRGRGAYGKTVVFGLIKRQRQGLLLKGFTQCSHLRQMCQLLPERLHSLRVLGDGQGRAVTSQRIHLQQLALFANLASQERRSGLDEFGFTQTTPAI
ncbi:transposase, partial [Chitiniphilus shinanonensis]